MAGLKMFEQDLQIRTPHSYAALQKLVMAMADYVNSAGKTTWFGRDKGQKAYAKFLAALQQTCRAMIIDKIATEVSPENELLDSLEELLQKFSLAYPSWQEAYAFAADLLGPRRTETLALIARFRSAVQHSDNIPASASSKPLYDDPNRPGGPNHPWICEPPPNLDELREQFRKILSADQDLQDQITISDLLKVDAAIAETLKMAFLEHVFGKRGEYWDYGDRVYLKNSIQTQVILFKDDRPPLTFYTDFSKLGAF